MYSNEVRRTVKDGLHTNLCICVAGLYMYSNEVWMTVKDGLHINLYICVAGLYMYSNEVRRTVKDGLHLASLGSGDLETRLGIKHPLHRKAGLQYLSGLK